MNNFPSGTVHKSIHDLSVSMNFSGEVQGHNKKFLKKLSRLNSHLHAQLYKEKGPSKQMSTLSWRGFIDIPSVLEAELSVL